MALWASIANLYRRRRYVALYGEPTPSYTIQAATECATVSACLTLVGSAIANLEFKTSDSRLREVLHRPNDWQTRRDFIQSLVFSVLSAGNAYMLRPGGRLATPVALFDPTDVRVTSGAAPPAAVQRGFGDI